ncbi:MAG: hypothetical protein L3K11_04880 [Thermoplasmata archaeon]|nr:hypothetical protein [Thermoplasmata archaeon]
MRGHAHGWWHGYWGPRLLAVLAVAVVLVVLLADAELQPKAAHGGYDTTASVVSVGAALGPLASTFFGVNMHDVAIGEAALTAQVNSTPFTLFRFTPNGESTDQVRGLAYNASGFASPTLGFTDADFVRWCEARQCQSMMMVPAEVNSTALAVATVVYVEQALGFHPTYWAIGNEPQQWTHFNIPWLNWRPNDFSVVTPAGYAREVLRYAMALRTVDPTIQLIGLESTVGSPVASAWFRNVTAIAGPYLTAVAYHGYPGGNATGPASLRSFYSSLANPTSFPGNYPATVATVRAACRQCNVSVFVDEFDSALGGSYRNYLETYSNAVLVAAGLVKAIREEIPRVLYFDLADLDPNLPYALLLTGGQARPTFALFSQILENLTLGEVFDSQLSGNVSGVYSVVVQSPLSTSLLVVDTNVTAGLQLQLPSSLTGGIGGTVWSWSPATSLPTVTHSGGSPLAAIWTVPPQGIFLVTVGTAAAQG